MKRVHVLGVLLLLAGGVVVDGQTVRPLLLGIGQTPLSGADAFFDDTVLHEVRLDINTKDWQSLQDHYLENTYYPCDMRWRDQTVRGIGIRSRGTGSRSGIKPGLRVDFDRYTTDQKFLGLKSFILRNNTQDASNMRERLSMLLFRRLGLPASREAHTKLYVNNVFAGVYTIVESVDKDFAKRNFGEDGGWIFKYDYPSYAYYFEDKGSNPDTYVPAPFKPETHENDPRPEVVVQLVQAINQTSDAVFRTAIAEYIDLQKFIRHVAVETFLADYDDFLGDFGMNNFYIYRFQDRKLFQLIAWDKSQAFSSPTFSIWRNIRGVNGSQMNRLMTRALASRDLYDLYLDTLLECVRSINEADATDPTDTRGWLLREIDRENTQIRDAVFLDPQKNYTNEQFDGEVSKLREFAQQRGDFVTAEVNASR
jgi:spore coat protein CotH